MRCTVFSGCFQNGNNQFFLQLAAFKDVLQVLGNGRPPYAKQFRHPFLAQPGSLSASAG